MKFVAEELIWTKSGVDELISLKSELISIAPKPERRRQDRHRVLWQAAEWQALSLCLDVVGDEWGELSGFFNV